MVTSDVIDARTVFKKIIKTIKDFAEPYFLLHSDNFYHLRLEGQYYCHKKKCLFVLLQNRLARFETNLKLPLKQVVTTKALIEKLHPVDTFILGLLANHERNGIVDKFCLESENILWFPTLQDMERHEPLLSVKSQYYDYQIKMHKTVLQSISTKKEVNISTYGLLNHTELLAALPSVQTISLGYTVSECYISDSLNLAD